MWGSALDDNWGAVTTPAHDVPTESAHMPATATTATAKGAHHDLNFRFYDTNLNGYQHHNHRNQHDGHPRIYLSSRLAGDHIATSGSPPASSPTANMVNNLRISSLHRQHLTSSTPDRTS